MKGRLLLLSGMSLVAAGVSAQQLQPGYIVWPESDKLPTYVENWVPGKMLFEDEYFFVSRVKPRVPFRNINTQVDRTLTADNDKKVIYWVPVGYSNWEGVHTDALPNGKFDSEAFSTWSYLTHYGDWTSPHGWVPGGFADVAHKNGVAVSGVASIPFGGISSNWSECLNKQIKLDNEKFAKFLYYHGVDGLGYNSEFSAYSQSNLAKVHALHAYLSNWMADKNPLFENVWYDGTNDRGSISFDNGLGSHNQVTFGDSENKSTSLFLNYNWNSADLISRSETKAREMGRDPRDLYAGHNMQGGEPRGGRNWEMLKDCNLSLGLWGAHSSNMIWQSRNSNGSAPQAMQNTYQRNIERWFSNGARNPIADRPFYQETAFSPSEKWFGISKYLSARSTLSWSLDDEPFYSYFNLGNGHFFNWCGKLEHNTEWYNISVQDYMPTWRFWFANEFLGNTPANVVENGLNAEFVWDQAWMGGSSLRINGTSADEYLHLFKTQFALRSGDVITVRYKLLGGKADINLCLSAEGKETTILRERNLAVMTTADEADEDVWVEKTFKVSGQLSQLNGKTIAMIALHIANAENLDIRLGEVSIARGQSATPAKPEIALAKALAYNYSGLDAKVVFNMPNAKMPGEPVYNSDVLTSMFKIYVQQEGEEPVFTGVTTSWAALAFAVPVNNEGAKRVRIGVAAVSLDTKSDSETAWSEYLDMPEYVLSEDIQINKSSIKPNESFTISFVDPTHPGADWAIVDQTGTQITTATDVNTFEVAEGLSEIGAYDLVINKGKENERVLNSFIQITAWERGALPEITSIAINGGNGEEVSIEPLEQVELSYTGRESDGQSSRGVKIAEKLFGVQVQELGLDAYHSFSVGAWIKIDEMSKGTYSFLRIENRSGSWPKNNWGFFWSDINEQGYFLNDLHDSAFGGSLDSNADGMRLYCDYRDSRIVPNGWMHVMFVFDYNDSKQLSYEFYINGKRQTSRRWMEIVKSTRENAISGSDWNDFEAGLSSAASYGDNMEKTGYASSSFPVTALDWISFGGTTQNIGAMNATIDDFQIWDKAVTAEDVAASMAGLDPNNLPENVLAYWDLESDDDFDRSTNTFIAKGKKAGARAGWYEHNEGKNEGQAFCNMLSPEFTSGSPFIAGTGYNVVTLPTWSGRRAQIADAQGNATAGSAKVSYKVEGDFNVTLTLENSLGSHSMNYPVINVSKGNAVEGIESDNNTIYAVGNTVFAGFEEAGDYEVAVTNMAGAKIASRTIEAAAGQVVAVTVNVPAVYVVTITSNGVVLRSAKVVVR